MRIRNKFITALLAAFMIMAAFLMPITAYATEIPDDPETINSEDYVEDDPTAVSDSEELDGLDLSELLELFGAFDMSEFEDETPESAIPDNSTAFTPDGQASVVDLAYEGDGKMFYTFKTPAGNVFYLIIDRERAADNVYFLNAVTENDLLALAENAGKVPESAIPTNPPNTTENGNGTGENPNGETGEENPPPVKKSNTGMIIFIVIGIAAVGGAAYYIKIVRPKKNAGMDDDDDYTPDEDDGEEIEFEDEADESGEEYEETADSETDEDRE